MSDKKLCTCEPNWICENCQTIEKLQQEISRLKNKIINLGDTIKVSELREWLNNKRVDVFPESEDYKIGYSIALDHVFMKFCCEVKE